MQESNPYKAPDSALETPNEGPVGGSLENALAGNFTWTIGGVISEAWKLQSGAKLPFWGAFILYYAVVFALAFVLGWVFPALLGGVLTELLSQIIIGLVTWPMMAGLTMMAVKRAAGLPIRATMIFDYYPRTLPIFLLYLAMTILIGIGFVLLVLPGIYLAIAFSVAVPLMLEKNLGVLEALETSRKVITKCWFRVFGLVLLMTLITAVSALPLGIGLIWTLPMMMLIFGIIYRDMFGVNEQAAAA